MGYKVVRADIVRERKAVQQFWDAHHEYKLQFKYRHFYFNNPAGPARLWLLKKEKDQAIIGMIAMFPRRIFIKSSPCNAGVVGDLFVAPRHRALGPAIMLLKSVTKYVDQKKIDFVYTFPNQKADIVTRRGGFTCLGNLDRFVRVIDSQPYLEKRGTPRFVNQIVAPIFNYLNRFFPFVFYQGLLNNISSERVQHIDSSFDELWTKVNKDNLIIGDRSSSYLQWRMIDSGGIIFAVYSKPEHRLLGYAACATNAGFVNIRDFVIPAEREATSKLFMSILNYAYKSSAQAVNVLLLRNKKIEYILKQYGYLKRRNNRKVYFYRGDSKEIESYLLENYKNWFLMSGDSDSMGATTVFPELDGEKE